MDQRKYIIKLTREGHSEKEIEDNLKIQFSLQAYSRKTIYKWFTLTKFGKENESNEKPGPKTDEQLICRIIQVLDEFPYTSTRQITDILNENESTIYRYLTRELILVYKHSKWLPYSLTKRQKFERMKKSKELFAV